MRVTLLGLFLFMIAVPAGAQEPANDSILVDEYIVKQNFVEAEIVKVNPRNRTMTVRGERRGATRQFTVPEGARITVQGRQARLRDLRRGDRVLLTMSPTTEPVVVARVQVPETNASLEQRRENPPAEEPAVVAEVRPTMLPSTASHWPLILLVGLLSAAGAASLRRLQRQ